MRVISIYAIWYYRHMKERFQGYNNDLFKQALDLDVTPEKLHGIETALGPNGIGTFPIRSVLDNKQIGIMQREITDSSKVRWHSSHDEYINKRGIKIVQNHDSFALKLLQGDQSQVDNVPAMKALASNIEEFIQALSTHFPNLASWQADEMSLHRYDADIGLSYHKDNLRFTGLIAVLTLEGASDFAVKDASGNEVFYPVTEGDLMLTRATNLYPAVNENGNNINLCPDHAVLNLRTPYRTSFIVRANSRPNEQIQGFHFNNWQGN